MAVARSILAGLILAAALAVAAGAALAQNIPGTAARVNGAEISNFRLERHFEDYLKGQRRNISSMINPKVYKKLKREALDQLIEREVLWQAAKSAGEIAGDDEVRAALKQFEGQFKTREAYLRKLEHGGFDEKSYGEYIRQELSGARYLVRESTEVEPPTDAQIAEQYRLNLHRYEQPEMVSARHVLIKVANNAPPAEREAGRARIAGVLEQARAGADFAELARRYSEDPRSAAQGGDLGEFPRGKMVKPFDDAAFALEAGAISGIVETSFGFHVIKVDAHTPAKTLSLEEASGGIRERLLAEKRTQLARDVTAKLRAAAKVEILVSLVD